MSNIYNISNKDSMLSVKIKSYKLLKSVYSDDYK